jgi:hypothetical protein
MDDVGIFYGHLVHFTVFCYILWTFSIVRGNLVFFGILSQEKSGNPATNTENTNYSKLAKSILLFSCRQQGCQIFLRTTYQKRKIYQIPKKYQQTQNISSSRQIYQMYVHIIYHYLQLQDQQKFTQIGILGLKTSIYQPW